MITPYPDVFAEFTEAARRGVKRFVSVQDVGDREGVTLTDTPLRIEAAPVFDFGFLRDLSTGKALDLDVYNGLVAEGEERLYAGTFQLPFPEVWYVIWFSDADGARYGTVNLLHAIELDGGGVQLVVYARSFDAPGEAGKWMQEPVQAVWHPDLGWGVVTETRFSSDHWYAERKANIEVAFANMMVATLLLARHPDPLPAAETEYLAGVNRGRARGKLKPLPAVRLIDLTKYNAPAEEGDGSRQVRPHDRRGHYRRLNTGRLVPVRPAKIHGGSSEPPKYKVRW